MAVENKKKNNPKESIINQRSFNHFDSYFFDNVVEYANDDKLVLIKPNTSKTKFLKNVENDVYFMISLLIYEQSIKSCVKELMNSIDQRIDAIFGAVPIKSGAILFDPTVLAEKKKLLIEHFRQQALETFDDFDLLYTGKEFKHLDPKAYRVLEKLNNEELKYIKKQFNEMVMCLETIFELKFQPKEDAESELMDFLSKKIYTLPLNKMLRGNNAKSNIDKDSQKRTARNLRK